MLQLFRFRSGAVCSCIRIVGMTLVFVCIAGAQQSPSSDSGQPGAAIGAQPIYPGLPAPKNKIETDIGPFKARFYGTVLLNGSVSSKGVFGQDLPLWALPDSTPVAYPDGTTGRAGNNHDFIMTMRQSILGVTVAPSKTSADGWTPSGLVEIDFFGTRPVDTSQPLNRVLDQPRLRLAYLQLDHKSWRIVAGQDKAIFAPLDPVSLSHVAAPLGATAGDLWGWFPQVRVDWSHSKGDTGWLFQVGILRPQFGDPRLETPPAASTSIDIASSGLGERSSQPFYEARFAVSPQFGGNKSTFGVSTHFGEEKVGVNRTLQSWGFSFDMNFRLQRHAILRGEGFVGSNLIPFQGGVDQGAALLAVTGQPVRIQRIGDAGGWAELTLLPKVGGKDAIYLGAGTDDPVNHNLLPGSGRAKNSFLWASYFHRFADQVTFALEWSYWDFLTINFVNNNPGPRGPSGTSHVVSASLAYQF